MTEFGVRLDEITSVDLLDSGAVRIQWRTDEGVTGSAELVLEPNEMLTLMEALRPE